MRPERVGKYRLEAPLGEGGQGLVYRAVAEDTNQTVALKLVPAEKFPDEGARQRFLKDAQAAVGVSHPHLRQLYEVSEAEGQFYLAMEYLEGVTLKSVLVSGSVEPEAALAWAAEIADALAAAHARGVVHGDLRPAKVFITTEGGVKLLDVGLWRLASQARYQPGVKDPPLQSEEAAAMSPEQVEGQEPEARSDVFALGSLLYRMIAGRHPFAGRNVLHTLTLVRQREPEPLGEQAPAGLDELLGGALEKDPRVRLASAAEVAAGLRAVAAGEALPVRGKRAVLIHFTWPLWLAIGVLFLLLVVWFLFLAVTGP
ncbi:serine/threonine protein kinase [Acidobacteriia bacterium AH_259_A11_L15]|nr:serine/threonine protein kinase [Acidobacteriia bacterium AH_259_A11_L15]